MLDVFPLSISHPMDSDQLVVINSGDEPSVYLEVNCGNCTRHRFAHQIGDTQHGRRILYLPSPFSAVLSCYPLRSR